MKWDNLSTNGCSFGDIFINFTRYLDAYFTRKKVVMFPIYLRLFLKGNIHKRYINGNQYDPLKFFQVQIYSHHRQYEYA